MFPIRSTFAARFDETMVLRIIFIHIMAFFVLASSAGLPLNRHYCETNHFEKTSLTPFKTACDTENKSSCQSTCNAEKKCCTAKKDKPQERQKNCCHDQITYLKGLNDIELQKTQLKNAVYGFTIVMYKAVCRLSEQIGEKFTLRIYSPPDPPPLSGKFISIFFHQLKLGGLVF